MRDELQIAVLKVYSFNRGSQCCWQLNRFFLMAAAFSRFIQKLSARFNAHTKIHMFTSLQASKLQLRQVASSKNFFRLIRRPPLLLNILQQKLYVYCVSAVCLLDDFHMKSLHGKNWTCSRYVENENGQFAVCNRLRFVCWPTIENGRECQPNDGAPSSRTRRFLAPF